MKQEVLYFRENGIIKSAFHKNEKTINTDEVLIYNDRVYTNFQHNKITKDDEYCACLSVILLDSVFFNSDKE